MSGQRDEELVGRLRAWIEEGRPQAPTSLHLSPTMACDLNCLFCRRQDQLRGYYQENREIPNARYLKLVGEALSMGVRSVTIKGGGEPTLRRSLMLALVPLIKSHGASGYLVTNGTHLGPELCRAFAESRWDMVAVSLDGPDAKTHDFLRGKPGTFARVEASWERLARAKREAGTGLPVLGFHCVLTRSNYARLEDLVNLAARVGAGHVELDSLSPRGEHDRALRMRDEDVNEFQRALPRLLESLKRRGLSHNFESFRRAEYVRRGGDGSEPYRRGRSAGDAASPPCYYPFYQVSLTPAGHLVPCCYAEETHRSEANLHEASFREAWTRLDPERYRRSMLSGEMMPFCRDCTAMYADNNERIRGWLAAAVREGEVLRAGG